MRQIPTSVKPEGLRALKEWPTVSKKAKADRQGNQLDRQQQREFWSVVLPEVAVACAPFNVWGRSRNVPSVQVWESVPNSPGRIAWQMWLSSRGSWICVRIEGESGDEVDHYFNALLARRDELDDAFGPGLLWDPLEGSRTSVIRWDNPIPGGYRTDPDDWPKAGDAMADAMKRLVSSTTKLVPELPRYEGPDVPGTSTPDLD